MDSLNLIGDINNRISYLSNKIDVTSKSASIAFSYLFQKITEVPNYKEDINNIKTNVGGIDTRLTYCSYVITNSLEPTVASLLIDNNNSTVSLNNANTQINSIKNTLNKYNNDISSMKSDLNDIKETVKDLSEKITNILTCPDGYIVVRKQSTFKENLKKIGDFFYKIFHYRQIKNEKIRIEKEKQEAELRRIEEEKRLEQERKEAELRRKQEEEKTKQLNRSKIKELLKK